jgi:hypothetical protein
MENYPQAFGPHSRVCQLLEIASNKFVNDARVCNTKMAIPSRYLILTIANFVIDNTTAITTNYPFLSME